MTTVTLSKAAQLTGKSKSVISKAIDDNKLNATRDARNWFKIDTEELFALYPPKQNRTKKELLLDIEQYKQQIALLTQQLANARAERDLLQSSNDHLSDSPESNVTIKHLHVDIQPTEIDKHISRLLKCLDDVGLSTNLLLVYQRLLEHYLFEWEQFHNPIFQRFARQNSNCKFVYQMKSNDVHNHILYGTALSNNTF
jgi:hypothetical protein